MSAVCAALEYQQSDDDAESSHFDLDSDGDGGNDMEEDDPQWILYNHVKDFPGDDGEIISEPFMKLPSRKCVYFYLYLVLT